VVKSGYRGHIGIEYEGEKHEELDGIRRTKQVLDTLAEQYA
jgi:L-ribulose-5-phosphate 3-epimerase